MRTLPGTAGCLIAALCLTACEADHTITGLGGSGERANNPGIAVTPARLFFRLYALVPERDPVAQILAVRNSGGGNLVWTARSTAKWVTLLPAAGTGAGQVRVQLNRGILGLGVNGFRPAGLNGMITISAAGASKPAVQIPISVAISYLPRSKLLPGEDPDPLRKPMRRGTIMPLP